MKTFKEYLADNKIPGGLADNKTLKDVAKHHDMTEKELQSEYDMGMKVEMEHTTDKQIAHEICLDHLMEDPKYYTKLRDMEDENI